MTMASFSSRDYLSSKYCPWAMFTGKEEVFNNFVGKAQWSKRQTSANWCHCTAICEAVFTRWNSVYSAAGISSYKFPPGNRAVHADAIGGKFSPQPSLTYNTKACFLRQ